MFLASLHPCILAGLTTCVRHIYPLSSSRSSVLLPPSSFLLHITPSETNIFLSCVSKLSLASNRFISRVLWSLKSTEVVFNFASLDLQPFSHYHLFDFIFSNGGTPGLGVQTNKSHSGLQNVLQKGFIPCVPNKGR